MSLKEEIKNKVPAKHQSSSAFKSLLVLVEQKKFTSVRALRMFLDSQIAMCKANLKSSSAVSTGQHHRRECAKHLKLYNAIKKFLPYL